MRVMPLHNIREPGLIPNGFQKEDAPPAAPDPVMQPDMRNRAEAQTDTRHAIEYLNPRTRMETNSANRSNFIDQPRIEMGKERQQGNPAGSRVGDISPEVNEAYERLLRILLGQDFSAARTAENRQAVQDEEFRPLEMEGTGQTAPREINAYHQAAALGNLFNRPAPAPEMEPREQSSLTYQQRRGMEIYRSMQAFVSGSILHEA